MKKMQGKLTYANVVSSLCLFLLLGGGAYAATQLPKNSIGAEQIKKGSITPAKLSSSAKAALKGAPGATGATGATGPQGPKGDPGSPATTLWAVLDGSGGLVRGSGATSAALTKTGVQKVVFNQNVSACTFIATPGTIAALDGVGFYPGQGEAAVSPLEGNPNGIVISRAAGEEKNEFVNYPVYVAVFC
jgi:hypothetical protein